MDNYIKHLLDKIPTEKKITKDIDNKNLIKISLKKEKVDSLSYLKSMSETYKICGEIVEHLKNTSVHVLPDEIIIIY